MRTCSTLTALTVTLAMTVGARPALAQDKGTVSYHLETVMHGEDLTAVKLVMRFKADAKGQAELDLPSEWGGGQAFYKRLEDLTIEGAQSVTAPSPAVRMIKAPAGATLTASYMVEANRTRGQDVPLDSNYTYPVVAPDWFYIAGPSLIATVKGQDPAKARFDWTLPQGWTGATNLQHALSQETGQSEEQSVFLAGKDVHIATLKVPDGELRIAWRGRFNFTSDAFNTATHDIIAAEQGFWGEGQRHFLVTLSVSDTQPGRSSIRGSGLGDAFAMVATPDADLNRLRVILAHEYFHSWNPIRLGGFDEGDDERAEYWFSEGFTDYYGRKLAYESGAVDASVFASEWNEALAAYAASPYRTSPNAVIVEKFWTDGQVQKLPYQRGALLAVWLDKRWHAQSKSLDGFMHVLRDQARADARVHAPHMTLSARLNRAAQAYGVDFGDLIDRYMIRGEAMELPEDAFGPRFKVMTDEVPVLDLGYDVDKSRAAGTFVGVEPDGPAYAAGLREGMKRVSSDGNVDSRTVLTWHVLDLEGKPRDIVYTPAGKATVPQQKLVQQ